MLAGSFSLCPSGAASVFSLQLYIFYLSLSESFLGYPDQLLMGPSFRGHEQVELGSIIRANLVFSCSIMVYFLLLHDCSLRVIVAHPSPLLSKPCYLLRNPPIYLRRIGDSGGSLIIETLFVAYTFRVTIFIKVADRAKPTACQCTHQAYQLT